MYIDSDDGRQFENQPFSPYFDNTGVPFEQPNIPFGMGAPGQSFGPTVPAQPFGQTVPGQPFGPTPPPGQPFGPGVPGQGFGLTPGFAAPSGPPPSFIPQKPATLAPGGVSVYAVDPGAIRFCLYKFTYIWLINGRSFWVWLVFVGPTSIAGFRWTGFGWRYFGTDIRNIDTFVCY